MDGGDGASLSNLIACESGLSDSFVAEINLVESSWLAHAWREMGPDWGTLRGRTVVIPGTLSWVDD